MRALEIEVRKLEFSAVDRIGALVPARRVDDMHGLGWSIGQVGGSVGIFGDLAGDVMPNRPICPAKPPNLS